MLKKVLKSALRKLNIYDYHFTPLQIWYRFLRSTGFGIDSEFSIEGKKFRIAREAKHTFDAFNMKTTEHYPEIRRFLELSKDKSCFLDIGAFYGIFSMVFCSNAQSKSAAKTAYAFDPSPQVYKILNHHVKINPGMDFHAYNVGLGAKKSKLRWKYEYIQLVVVPENEKNYDFASSVTTLDSFLRSKKMKKAPDIVKIDTEGSEYNVLMGGKEFFKDNSPLIFLEVHKHWLKDLGISIKQLSDLLENFGYSNIYDLDLNKVDTVKFSENQDNFRIICSKTELNR